MLHLERRGSVVVSTSAWHAAGRGSLPGPATLLGEKRKHKWLIQRNAGEGEIGKKVKIGVNMTERKSGTERTKKRKKRELVFFQPPGARNR